MASQRNTDLDFTVDNRCPAGSHIRATATDPNGDSDGASKTAYKSFLATDMSHSSGTGETHHGHLTDLAYAAEHARIEARKNHKRFTDAIYARRRRLREKADEKDLVREAEYHQQVNKKLREENKELQSMLSSAIAEIEAKGDTEKEWLRGVLDKAKTTEKPTSNVTDVVSDGTYKSSSSKRLARYRPTVASTEASSTQLPSSKGRSDSGSTHLEDTTTISTTSRPLNVTTERIEAASVESHHPSRHGNDGPHRSEDRSIEALRQASYLQGLQDAVLLNQRRDILAATQHLPQQQPQSPPPLPPAAANATAQADIRQSALLNDPIHQRTVDQLLLVRRINAMTGYPDPSVLRPELTSLLDRSSLLMGGYNPASDLLSRNTSILGYPPDSSMLAALAGLQNFGVPPVPPPTLPPQLTAAQLLALSTSTNSYQLQMQLGLLNAYTDRTNVLTSLLQHHQQQEQQISLLTHLQQQHEPQPPPPNSSSSTPAPPGEPPRPNFPP